MKYTLEKLQKMMKNNGGSLDLRGTQITSLPDNLTVGGSLYLSDTQITSLPDNLTVGGWLDLRGTQITSLPDNLTVGGSLDLSGTQITSPKYKKLADGDYAEGRYIYCDGMLTHIKSAKQAKGYTYYVGKIKNKNVISDGKYFAHCKSFKDGIADLEFKKASSRGAEQYKRLTLESKMSLADTMAMYRIITGACKQGTEQFVNNLREVKEEYTVREMIELTKNAYRGDVFERFFKEA